MKLFHDLMANILIRWSNWHFVRGSFQNTQPQNLPTPDMFWPMIEKDVYVGSGNKLN